nr:reverse transcriptase domain-containing protein [Tanacetum cinerariifolium]
MGIPDKSSSSLDLSTMGPKTGRKEAAAKDKPTTIYMVRSWQRTFKQKITQSFEQGKEITFPPLTTSNGIEGPLVIEAEISGHTIHRMYIDGGSSMEILYEHCFNRLRPDIKSQMAPATTSLTGFSGETTWPLGWLRLLVTIGDVTHSTKAWMNFMIVKSLSPYNGIIGRPGLKAIQAVPSTVHEMLKFLIEVGIVTIHSTLLIPAECASVDTSSVTPREKKTRPANLTVTLHPNFPDQEVVVGGSLSDKGRTELCSLLKKNLDIFAWQPFDMTGVPQSIAEHRLNIQEGCPPSNPVMVKKHDGSWRMCVDFTDLNKACPQDCYPLPEIDWKVESFCGYPFKCFLDAYKGYHKIQLAAADKEKTAFHTRQGVYCHTKIPFGLKNAGATYQRLMDKEFENGSGAGLILTNPDGVEFTYALRFQFAASNNEAEYEALIAGLQIVTQIGVKNIQANVDSKLVANQVLGTYVAKEDNMIKYLEIAKGLVSGFKNFSISQVPRSKNKKADALSKIASTSFTHLSKQVFSLEIKRRHGSSASRPLSGKVGEGQVTDSRNGLLHEVDRSKGCGNDYRRTGEEIRMGQYCMPLRYSERNNLRQWQTSNGLVDRANRSLGEGIKARLEEGNKNWVEELPHVLWAHRTMIKTSHGDTPFSLTYGTKAVIPAEIGMPTYRTTAVDVVNNDEELRLNLDLLEECRELAAMSEAKSKSKMMKYYNSRVRGVAFKPGDFVYRSNDASHAVAEGKLGPK